MPRDGSNIYSQPFPDVTAGTEIESAVYNGFTSDVTIDLNTPRPIIAGGTGATSANDALANMGGEKSTQLVTNFSSHLFYPGSFRCSNASGQGAPVDGHAFAGICYLAEPFANPPTNQNLFLEARDLDDTVTPARKYVREKSAGVWGAWTIEGSVIGGDDTKVVFSGTGTVGVSNTNADMFYGVTGTAPSSAFVVNTESDASGTNAFSVRKDGTNEIRRADGNAFLELRTTGSGKASDILGYKGSQPRWLLRVGDDAAESGLAVGSNFTIHRYNNDGSYGGNPFIIERSTGNVGITNTLNITGTLISPTATFNGMVTVNGDIHTARPASPTTAAIYLGNAGNYLYFDGTNFNFSSGPAVTATSFNASYHTSTVDNGFQMTVPAGNNARFYSHVSGARVWTFGTCSDATFQIIDSSGGATRLTIDPAGTVNIPVGLTGLSSGINIGGGIVTSGNISCTTASNFNGGVLSYGYRTKAGTGSGYNVNWFNIDWGAGTGIYIDTTLTAFFNPPSDYRIKKDIVPLPSTWDAVKALRPIKYTRKQFSPPSQLEFQQKQRAAKEPVSDKPLFENDDTERWGFVAHELQETLIQSAAYGAKDSPDTIQAPDSLTVIAALTKALQEAMTRIEALEAAK